MPARAEVLTDWPEGGEKALRMARRREATHRSFALTCWLMGVFGTSAQPFMATTLDARQHLLVRCFVTAELVRDEHTRYVLAPVEPLMEEVLGRRLVPPTLHQDIQHVAVLVNGPPEVVDFAVDRDEDFVEVPVVV